MKIKMLLIAAMLVVLSGVSKAALFDRGCGLIYNDVLNITWLQDANYAHTIGYVSEGSLSWDDAVAWVDDLEFYDSVRDVTWKNFRLPNTPGTQMGYLNEGELGHLFYVEGINSLTHGLFTNVKPGYYWFGKEYSPDPSFAWVFDMNVNSGYHGIGIKTNAYVLPVIDGDVPIPGAVWLLGSGLIALVGLRKKFKK